MFKIRNLLYLVIIGVLLLSACKTQQPATSIPENPVSAPETTAISSLAATQPPATATPEPIPTLDPALQRAMKLCENIIPGQACLVEGPVQVTAQPDRFLMPFAEPGQTLTLADIQTLKLGEAGSAQGIVVMRIQTEWLGGAFDIVAFGVVDLVNEVPFGTREFNPMQSLKLATGPNIKGQPPLSGFFVSSPEGSNLSTLVVNGVELSFGSGAMLSSPQGGLSIQTQWGSVGVWMAGKLTEVAQGTKLDLSGQMIENEQLESNPAPDPAYDDLMRQVDELTAAGEFLRNVDELLAADEFLRNVDELMAEDEFLRKIDALMNDPEFWNTWKDDASKKYRALEELRRKQKEWKGGWWKMTYGPVAVSGQCGEAAGDGSGGSGQPFTTEIPVCRGNNGNTILMYESGVSYDRVGPNLFAQSFVSEFDLYGNGKYTTEGMFMTLQVVSPTRMILSNARTEKDACTYASVVYLDFVRDDPNVRCGEIIYISPWETPEAPTPTPEPQKIDPPIKGPYQVRLGTLGKACDPAAKPFAPNFTAAGLSLSPGNNLVLDADTAKYELELSTLTYPYSSDKIEGRQDRLGIFTLQQPVEGSFSLMMSLMQMPEQLWTGSWLVSNEDGTQICGGSIDLLPPK